MRRLWTIAGILAMTLTLIGPVMAQEASPIADVAPESDAAAYCESVGGIVRERTPVYGTNLAPDQQIVLGGARDFCEFTGGEGADDDGSWMSIAVDTLYAERPTLATIAYLTKAPIPEVAGGANPSAVHCVALGGAYDFGGAGMNGGGWVTSDPAPALDVLNMCVFPDGSMIDSWGLTYHSGDVIRGVDLTPLLRYQPAPDDLPYVFGAPSEG